MLRHSTDAGMCSSDRAQIYCKNSALRRQKITTAAVKGHYQIPKDLTNLECPTHALVNHMEIFINCLHIYDMFSVFST